MKMSRTSLDDEDNQAETLTQDDSSLDPPRKPQSTHLITLIYDCNILSVHAGENLTMSSSRAVCSGCNHVQCINLECDYDRHQVTRVAIGSLTNKAKTLCLLFV